MHCFHMENDVFIENLNIKDLINFSLTKNYLQKDYEKVFLELSSVFSLKTKSNIICSFPLPCTDIDKLNSLITDTVTFKGKDSIVLMDEKEQQKEIQISQDVYMANLSEAFNFDIDDIQLIDEDGQIGLIDKDESSFIDPDKKEEGFLSDKLLDITYDTFFGDLGLIQDMEFYKPDLTLPYTFKQAKDCCSVEDRTAECNLKLQENQEIKASIKVKALVISWYLKNFGEKDFEINLGNNLDYYCKNKIKIKKGEEKINGHIMISDGVDIKLYKTQIYNLNLRKKTLKRKKTKIR